MRSSGWLITQAPGRLIVSGDRLYNKLIFRS